MESRYREEVLRLLASSPDIPDMTYRHELTEGLPGPVRRYFRYALGENALFIRNARVRHGGTFRTAPGKRWSPIKGLEYITVSEPGFVWMGRVPFVAARDAYIRGSGSLVVKLFSLIRVVNAKGPELDKAELLRWVAEAPWYPTALLPSERLRWEALDDESARVIVENRGVSVEGVFHMNQEGQIIRFTGRRYNGRTLEDWSGYYGDYRETGGMQIPHCLKAEWNLREGDFRYAEFMVTDMDFNLTSP